jgi:hypothetical protein
MTTSFQLDEHQRIATELRSFRGNEMARVTAL